MWILLALLARLIWAATNAVDQVFSRTHAKHQVLAALIVENICYLPYAALGYFLTSSAHPPPAFFLYCLGSVLVLVTALIPYFKVLQKEQSCNVVPYLELTPVFFIILAYFFKGEVLTPTQLMGAAIIVASGFLFSWDFARGHFKAAIFLLLSFASLCFALYMYFISQANLYADIWSVAACYYFGASLIGLILFAALKNVRKAVIETFVQTRGRTAILALSSNALSILGLATLLSAFRYAPKLDDVAALSGAQPIFSFLLAIPLAKFFPRHFEKMAFNRETLAKTILIMALFLGVYWLSRP